MLRDSVRNLNFKILKPSGLVETLNLNSFLNIKIQLKCPFLNAKTHFQMQLSMYWINL